MAGANVRKPSQAETTRKFVSRYAAGLFTLMPGRVVEYDDATGRASVQPLIRVAIPGTIGGDATEAESVEELPVLPDVPVWCYRTANARIKIPVKKDSIVTLLFATFSLEQFLHSDGKTSVDPKDTRHHDLSDAIAIPGLYPFTSTPPGTVSDAIEIVLDTTVGESHARLLANGDINLTPAAKLRLGSDAASERAILGDVFMTLFNAHTHPTPAGPSGITPTPMVVGTHLSPTVLVKGNA